MYCGNNRLHTTGKTIGTRYECLQRGIRYGKSLPVDPAYAGEYNPIDMASYQKPEEKVTDAFMHYLEKNRVSARLRRSRGKDIDAACGQLANKEVLN